jgi:MFS family permease
VPVAYGRDMPSAQSRRTFTPALLGLMWTAAFGFSGFFLSYSTMVTVSQLRGLSSVTGGAILTTMMVAVIAAQPAAPALHRRWGLRAAMITAIALQVAGQVLSLLIPHALTALVVGGLSGGVGFGLLVVLATAAVPSTTDPARVGRALGAFGAVTSGAAAVGAPAGLWLVGVIPLWSFRLVACALLLLAIPTVFAIPVRRHRTSLPAEPDADEAPARSAGGAADAHVGSAGDSVDAPGRTDLVALLTVLLPFLISMTAYGMIVAFGPGAETINPALYIAAMQGTSVISRLVSGAISDTVRPVLVYHAGIAILIVGILLAMTASPGWGLLAGMIVLGLGVGTVQSASLVMAFDYAGSPGRGSVAWNMSFDTGLALAGLFGGFGFTYLGPAGTYLLSAALLAVAGVLFFGRHRWGGPAAQQR